MDLRISELEQQLLAAHRKTGQHGMLLPQQLLPLFRLNAPIEIVHTVSHEGYGGQIYAIKPLQEGFACFRVLFTPHSNGEPFLPLQIFLMVFEGSNSEPSLTFVRGFDPTQKVWQPWKELPVQ